MLLVFYNSNDLYTISSSPSVIGILDGSTF
jgi:hypothetical protein